MTATGYGISVLVPLHLTKSDNQRAKNWQWLKQYWEANLPGAEIIIGIDPDADEKPFSKSVAVNNAASKAHGNIFVIIDADVYISPEAVIYCAEEIRLAENKGRNLWFMPYRKLYRLTEEASQKILSCNPAQPIEISPSPEDYTNTGMFDNTPVTNIGHWYGAMIQIMSRKAFYTVGGWDHRMRGWGGEDHAAMVAMDTLYGPHKTISSAILHIWHPTMNPDATIDPKGKKRLWTNQDPKQNNDVLSGRYYWSQNHPRRMRRLVDEFLKGEPNRHHRKHPCPVPYDPSI
jgi:glycosyltransferase involved in cell wall biosynthesis